MLRRICSVFLIMLFVFTFMINIAIAVEDDGYITIVDDFANFSKIKSKSTGLQCAKADPSVARYGDITSLARYSNTDEWITYSIYQAKRIEISSVFASYKTVEHFKFYSTNDGIDWTEIQPSQIQDKTSAGVWGSWVKFVYVFDNIDQEAREFKIRFTYRSGVGWENQLQSIKLTTQEYKPVLSSQWVDECNSFDKLADYSQGIRTIRSESDKEFAGDDTFFVKLNTKAEYVTYKLPEKYDGLRVAAYVNNDSVVPVLYLSNDNKTFEICKAKIQTEKLKNNYQKVYFYLPYSSAKYLKIMIPETKLDGWQTRISEFKVYLEQDNEYMLNTYPDVVSSVAFSDMKEHWAEGSVNALAKKGIIKGYDDNTFQPENQVTYTELATMLGRAGKSVAEPKNEGQLAVSRKAAAVLTASAINENGTIPFALNDLNSYSIEEQAAITKLCSAGILLGDEHGNFAGDGALTRAQAAVMIERLLFSDKRARPAGAYDIALCTSDNYKGSVDGIVEKLKAEGFSGADIISKDEIAFESKLKKYDCIIMLGATDATMEGKNAFLSYLKSGGDVVLAGDTGRKMYLASYEIPVFEDYEMYAYNSAVKVVKAEGQSLADVESTQGKFEGLSANGYIFLESSTFTPILYSQDQYGRDLGVAAGLMTFFNIPYPNGQWLIYGVKTPDFYKTPTFTNSLVQTLKVMKTGKNIDIEKQKRQDAAAQTAGFQCTWPAPEGFIKLSEDKTHFIYPDGRKMFIMGANYAGPMGMGYGFSKSLYTALEDDFRLASEYGINAFRLWSVENKNDERDELIKHFARKYGIYLEIVLPSPVNYQTDVEYAKAIEEVVRRWKDETMVFSYDLKNEPYPEDIGGMTFNGEKSPIIQFDAISKYPNNVKIENVKQQVDTNSYPSFSTKAKWLSNEDKMKIKAASNLFISPTTMQYTNQKKSYSTYPGYNGVFEASTEEFKPLMEAMNATFELWIKTGIDAVRRIETNHYITAGYNEIYALLNCNDLLDFQNVHVYQLPDGLKNFQDNPTTLDRLRIRFPNQPVTLGEFGYSAGKEFRAGEVMDINTEGVGEFANFLYPFAKGYTGSMIWMLNERCVPYINYNELWLKSKAAASSRYGMFAFKGDGTQKGTPKPVAYATRFFKEYAYSHEPGTGTMTFTEAKTRMGGGYVYEAPGALFVGDVEYNKGYLQFKSDKAVNVMLYYSNTEIKLMTTYDTVVKIKPSYFAKSIGTKGSVTGVHGEVVQDGETITVHLLAGETVVIK